jgi:hypothetical protein
MNNYNYKIEGIKSIQQIGQFEDEYVYDLEMDDDSHTFIANDILVHNSNYVNFDEVIKSCSWEGDIEDFIVKLNEVRFAAYLHKCFEIYADKKNVVNYQDFELETISESGLWVAKKKYILDVIWKINRAERLENGEYKFDGIKKKSLSNLTYKGIEIVQSSTPLFARDRISELVKMIFTKKKDLKLNELVNALKKMKAEFKLEQPDNITEGSNLNNYTNYIINDSTSFEYASGCPIHLRAAGYYNYLLNQNPKFKAKYEMLKSKDKLKFYYVKTKNEKENNVFGYIPGNYPYEFAPPIDYDEQFTKMVIGPINRLIEAMGYPPLNGNLFVSTMLF